jgi:transaldolase/glucose-6-phosphate isomerase
MTTTAQRAHAEFGQSIWYDNVQRGLLNSGEFKSLITKGVRGCTSNPTIFDKAIGGSKDYDAAIEKLVASNASVDDIYHALVIEDIQAAADALGPIYEESKWADGYISLEVQPKNAMDTKGTVAEALSLVKRVNRPNLMIKVPATNEGLAAITELTALGISVNVTLIFSRRRYVEVAEAFIKGLERASAEGRDLRKIASVASFFISRIDSSVDAWIGKQKPELQKYQGKVAIANAKLAYLEYQRLFGSDVFKTLAGKGAQAQRLLWASTGTKNPAYADTLYLDELVGRNTVNTVPPATLAAFLDHGKVSNALEAGVDDAKKTLATLSDAGLDLDGICEQLLQEGVKSFVESMEHLFQVIGTKREALGGR